ncbi:MAG: rod shape-determining protein MreC [Chlamydiota bacterium]
MRTVSYRPYLLLMLFFFGVLSLPLATGERLRAGVVCSFAPIWQGLHVLKEKSLFLCYALPPSASNGGEQEHLEQENLLLRSQMENVREWLLSEGRIHEQAERLKAIRADAGASDFAKRRSKELAQAIDLQASALPARVIFRDPASWSSVLWINIGERDNAAVGKKVVAKHSPVIYGTSIIGVVEYVGQAQSRVRLITDARLNPSVRVVRGGEQNRFLMEHLESLIFALEKREDLFSSEGEAHSLALQLSRLRGAIAQQSGDLYLAKGELHGSSHPLWRSRSQVLKGVGFNCDFADEEGPARDLRTGEPYHLYGKEPLALITQGDLLVTTGFDGVFPAGFRIAQVSSVQTLKEGASSYEIEAIPTAGNLNELIHISVLPALKS